MAPFEQISSVETALVGTLILGKKINSPPFEASAFEASMYCTKNFTRLPTPEEFQEAFRALGGPASCELANSECLTRNREFWAVESTGDTFRALHIFNGLTGEDIKISRSDEDKYRKGVWCVNDVPRQTPFRGLDADTYIEALARSRKWICESVADCQAYKKQVVAKINDLVAKTIPGFLEVVRGTDGEIKLMNRAEAMEYCASRGAHLPTYRELALYAQNRGAVGIYSDGCHSDESMCEHTCISERPSNCMYYTREGYHFIETNLRHDYWIWSSDFSFGKTYLPLRFNGQTGEFTTDTEFFLEKTRAAVMCAADAV